MNKSGKYTDKKRITGKKFNTEKKPNTVKRVNKGERVKPPADAVPSGLVLIGRNPVIEALKHDKPIDKIFMKKGEIEGSLTIIRALAKERGILVSDADRNKLDEMAEFQNHQGVIALCPAKEYSTLEDILQYATNKGEEPFIVVLDGITDTHNLGAIIRSAEAAGVHGVIIPKHRAAGLTGIVAKTSAGAIEHMRICKVTNITNTLEDLKKSGLWIACADVTGQAYMNADMKGPIALVIGAEGEGVSRLVADKCDFKVKIPMLGKIESLNASVAAGILMYEVVRRRRFS